MLIELLYDSIKTGTADVFNESYKTYITDHVNTYISEDIIIDFNLTGVTLHTTKCSTEIEVYNTIMFIGYALCQRDEGI